MKKSTTAVCVMTAAFFLTGCTNDGLADAKTSIKAITPIEKALVFELNEVSKKEKDLQETFETALSKGKDTKSFSDETSPVFKNIKERDHSLKTIKKTTNELKQTQKSLVENDGKKVPKKELTSLSDSMKELNTSLSEYTKQYSKNLSEEEKYFKSLDSKDATYKTLTDGITTINNHDAKNKEQLKKLNELFKQLENQRNEAEKRLNTLLDSTN